MALLVHASRPERHSHRDNDMTQTFLENTFPDGGLVVSAAVNYTTILRWKRQKLNDCKNHHGIPHWKREWKHWKQSLPVRFYVVITKIPLNGDEVINIKYTEKRDTATSPRFRSTS